MVLEPAPEGGWIVRSPIIPELVTEVDDILDLEETVKDAVAAAKELSFTLNEISRSRRWGLDWERPVVVNIRKNCYNENKETGMREQNSISKITLDPYICGGKPCIRDTRIEIAVILDGLAEGLSESDLIDHYPQLSKDDIHAALAYAAELAHESVWKPAVSA